MRRRVLILTSSSLLLTLAACASVLGDFNVDDNAVTSDGGPTADGALTDGASSGTGSTTSSSGTGSTTSSSGTGSTTSSSGGVTAGAPAPVALGVSLNATCATVKYALAHQVTYCWGEKVAGTFETLGAEKGDPTFGAGFYRPHPAGSDNPINFDVIAGGGTGDWFQGHTFTGLDYAWGDNTNGECALPANGTAGSASRPTPLKAAGSTQSTTTLWSAPGTGCLLSGGTTPFCWGLDNACQVSFGQGATSSCPSNNPPQRSLLSEATNLSSGAYVIDKIVGGVKHMCAARHPTASGGNKSSQVVCWGDNSSAQIGQGPPGTFNGSVVQGYYGTATTVPLGNNLNFNLLDIASGDNHVCALDKTGDGSISCWGSNASQQANPGAASSGSSPGIAVATLNLSTLGSGNVIGIALGGSMSCLVFDPSGSKPAVAYCWGAGPRGTTAAGAITKIEGIQDVTQIAIGQMHACAIARSANAADAERPNVWCWGSNANGQIVPGASGDSGSATPVAITFPPEPAN